MKPLFYFFVLQVLFTGFTQSNIQEVNNIQCNENGCKGSYNGAEFINGSDIAHQFSNHMSKAVGEELKKLYRIKQYKKVDFTAITMTTEGMGSGKVRYYLEIPFLTVHSKCDAFTSFDHVGGWNHKPALERRKKELKGLTLSGHKLQFSKLKKTSEGLQEYWIQWKNKKVQAHCK